MKKVFMAGLMVVLMLGLIGLIFKVVVMDFLVAFFRPFILLFTQESLIVPLTIVLTVILIFLIGLVASHIKFQGIIIGSLERMLPKGKHGVLVEKSDGICDLAIVIKKIELLRLSGVTQTFYLIFYPSSPVAWTSGLPIGLAREDKVTPIESSLLEIYSTIATFGKNAPDVIKESKNKKGTE